MTAVWGSALLLVALAAVMVRSFVVADGLTWTAWDAATGRYHARVVSLRSGRGIVGIEVMRISTTFKPTALATGEEGRTNFVWQRVEPSEFHLPRETIWQRAGFGRTTHAQPISGVWGSAMKSFTTWMPYWVLIGLAAIAPAHALIQQRVRSGRRRRGLCPHCGYDLRASSGQCPECGTPITETTPSAAAPPPRG